MGLDFRYEYRGGRRCQRGPRLVHLADQLVYQFVGLRMRDPLQEDVFDLVFGELVPHISRMPTIQKFHFINL